MQGCFLVFKKTAPSCISPNVPETLQHHLRLLRIQRRVTWVSIFLKQYWESRSAVQEIRIFNALQLVRDIEGSDRVDLDPLVRESWVTAISNFIRANQSIASATAVRAFSKTLRAYDNAIYAHFKAAPKQQKHLEAIFEARWAYEASACTAQSVAPGIATLAEIHFTTQDKVSRVTDQAAWQSFQATARVKEKAKHGFKIGFWMGVAMVAVIVVTVAAIVFSAGIAAIPALAGVVAAHSVAMTGLVAVAACAAPPMTFGSLFGGLGAGVHKLQERFSPPQAPAKAKASTVAEPVPVGCDSEVASNVVDALTRSAVAGPPTGLGRAGASTSSLLSVIGGSVVKEGLYSAVRLMIPPLDTGASAGESPQA